MERGNAYLVACQAKCSSPAVYLCKKGGLMASLSHHTSLGVEFRLVTTRHAHLLQPSLSEKAI